MTTLCETCDGSGVLNVEASYSSDTWVREVVSCHGCPAGATWRELGLDEVSGV